jgi:hypothetical protein
MVRKAKELVEAKGILYSPNPKPGKILKYDTVKLVHEFYTMMKSKDVCQGKNILHL